MAWSKAWWVGFLGTFLLLSLLRWASAAEIAYTFTTLDLLAEGEALHLSDINLAGAMVATRRSSDGFVIAPDHTITPIHCPDAMGVMDSTRPLQLNAGGVAVGTCIDGQGPASRLSAFLRAPDGQFTFLHYPQSDGTDGQGINDVGDVVGQFWGFAFGSNLDRFHGYRWRQGVFTQLDAPFPDTIATILLRINTAGTMIGLVAHRRPGSADPNDTDAELAFVVDANRWQILDLPGSVSATTYPMDIDNAGRVLLTASDAHGAPLFAFWQAGVYTTITGLPPAFFVPVDVWGMNDAGTLVGAWMLRFPCEACGPGGGPGFRVEIHNGQGVPTPPPPRCPPPLVSEVRGDLDGDGREDRAGLAADGGIWVAYGAGACKQLPGRLSQLVLGDFDANGQEDLAGVDAQYALYVRLNDTHWDWVPGAVREVAVADYLGAGYAQIVGVDWLDNLYFAPHIGQWQVMNGQLERIVSGRFEDVSHDELLGIGAFGSLWLSRDLVHWRMLDGQLTSLHVVEGLPDGIEGRGLDGLWWRAEHLNEWRVVSGR